MPSVNPTMEEFEALAQKVKEIQDRLDAMVLPQEVKDAVTVIVNYILGDS